MNLNEKQILEIKIILSGRTKTQIFNDLNIDKSYFSKIEKQPNAKNKLNEYFEKLDPEINLVIQKLIEMIKNKSFAYQENDNVDHVNDQKIEFQKKYIETLEKLQKSQEIRLKHLEEERKRFIEKYGPIYE